MAEEEVEPWSAFPWTAGLLGSCVAMFTVQVTWAVLRARQPLEPILRSLWSFEDLEVLQRMGALHAQRVWLDGEWWRVATAGFLHGSWLHLVLNLVGLWAVGTWLERALGGWRLAVIFVWSSVVGCLASLAWAEAATVVGASGGIFGLAGALVLARWWGDARTRYDLEPVPAGRLAFWLVVWLAIGWVAPGLGGDQPIIAQAGHVGGLLAGLVLGFGLRSAGRGPVWQRVVSYSSCLALTLGLGWAARSPDGRPGYHEILGFALLERGDHEGSRRQFEMALRGKPGDAQLRNAVAYALALEGVDLARAEALVRDALESEPDNRDFLDTLGWVLCRQGRTSEGLEVLQRVESSGDGFPELEAHIQECSGAGVPP